MFAFKTLQRRLIVLLVVPVTLFLMILGVFGYRFIQGILFKEWQEIAILRLERAAHQMDMKLHEQMEWMEAFARAGKDSQGAEIQRWLLQQIKSQAGVSHVSLNWEKAADTGEVKPSAGPVRRDVPHPILLSAGQQNCGVAGGAFGSSQAALGPARGGGKLRLSDERNPLGGLDANSDGLPGER